MRTRSWPAIVAALIAIAPAAAQQRVELTVAATTDVHGRLRGWDYYEDRADSSRGLARAATIVDSLRRSAPQRVILLDAGDLLQGNPMTFVAARVDTLAPHPVIAAMNAMRYDAAAVGNHEFNYGLPVLDRAISRARFPFLAANTERTDGGCPFAPFTIVRRGGVRVAIIGVTNPGAMVWDRDNLRGHLQVSDIVTSLPAQVRAVRAQGADVVVVVGHSGIGGESSYDTLASGRPSENVMGRVAREVAGIDLIVVGHSHREIADTTINGVLLVQPRQWAGSVAVATLTLERGADRRWKVVTRRGTIVRTAGHAEHPGIVKVVERAHQGAMRYATATIARTGSRWTTDSARLLDTPLIDLIQATQLKVTGADLSAASAFTTTASLAPGPITVGRIAQLYPYENTLRVLRLSGAQVRAYLEHSACYYNVVTERDAVRAVPDPEIPGYNFDILAGVEYSMDLSRPIGARIRGLSFKGRPVADTDSFTVAINNYRAGGGGAYDMLRGAPVTWESSTEIRQLLIDEVRRRGTIEPADVFVENWRLLQPARSLRIIAINDLHGALMKRPDGTAGDRGGAAEMTTLIKQAMTECAPLCVPVLLHGGDLFQGTPASNFAFGRPVVDVLNAIGVAAGALGNHEFDWGQDTLRARMRDLRSPVLGANVTYADGRDVPWIPDDTILELQGIKVGVVGIADPATPRTTMPRHVADLRFAPPAPVVIERSRSLRARGATKVILVAHLGGFCDRNDLDRCNGEIFELARATGPGVLDAIVSGHTHSQVNTVVNGIPIVQARLSGRAIGVIDIPLAGNAPPTRPQVRPVVSDSLAPDPAIAAIVRTAVDVVADRINAYIVDNAERLPRDGDQYALGNLIADAQRAAAHADVGVMNNGGIRTELRAGRVVWGDIQEIQPFENRMVAVTLRGNDLRRYLEGLVGGASPRYHVSGLVVEYDPKAAAGSRLRKVTMANGAALDDWRSYRVAMTEFLAASGDGVALPAGAKVEQVEILDIDALIAYLKAMPGGRLAATDALKAPRFRPLP